MGFRLTYKTICATACWLALTSVAASACVAPSEPSFRTPIPQAYGWFNAGVDEVRNGAHYFCMQRDFATAARLFRNHLSTTLPPTEHFDTLIYLAAALSYNGLAMSRLGNTSGAATVWTEAVRVHRDAYRYPQAYVTTEGDNLFARGKFRDAFTEYGKEIFQAGAFYNGTILSVQEMESGAGAAIRLGLKQAMSGEYALAATTFRRSPSSPAAYYLEGQAAAAAGDTRTAYRAYSDVLEAQIRAPAVGGADQTIGIYSYPAWLRLIALSNGQKVSGLLVQPGFLAHKMLAVRQPSRKISAA